MWVQQNSNWTRLFFLGSTNVTLTVGIQISKNGGGFADPNVGPSVLTELSDGWYLFTFNTTDTNSLGQLYYKLTGVTLENDAQLSDDVVPLNGGYLEVYGKALGANVINTTSIADGALMATKFAVGAIGPTTISDAGKLAIFSVPQLAEVYAANGVAPTPAQALMAILAILSNIKIVGTTLTVNGLDGTTPKMTFALNSATNPTERTRAT